jgi:ADP-ribose pyrophosphatase YjhB (NUDIX family)
MSRTKRYAGVIYKVRDKVLLCKRAETESKPGLWSIPSGHIEEGESPGQAAVREFFEETNIEIGPNLSLVGLMNIYKDDEVTKKGLMYIFLFDENVEKQSPDLEEAEDGHEHSECGFFMLENLPKDERNDQLYEILEKVLG